METTEVIPLTADHWTDVRPLYESSFPKSERIPSDEMATLIASGQRTGLVMTAGGRVVAMAITIELDGMLFLEYLAAEQGQRGRGLGSFMMGRLVDHAESTGSGAIVWEIESTTVETDPDDHDIRVRRANFYRRCGGHPCRGLGERFVAPGFDGELLEMELWEHTGSSPPLSADQVRSAATQILRLAYELDPSHPLVQENLARLAAAG